MGTAAYMSPEQASGRIDLLGPASDIYSLGATLYTLLAGGSPIVGKETAEALRKAQRGEWLPPRQVNPDVPAALDVVCRKAMCPKPSERYTTALEQAADVERWLADEPVAVSCESWAARSRRWMRRHRSLLSTAVGVLVTALIPATLGLILITDAWDQEASARKAIAIRRLRPLSPMPRRIVLWSSRLVTTRSLAGCARPWAEPTSPPIRVMSATAPALATQLEAAGVPRSLIQNVAEAVAHPQTQARNMVVRAGALLMAGNPIKIAGFADAPTRRPAPEFDADGDRIRRELGGE
jgi:hypothetical protein